MNVDNKVMVFGVFDQLHPGHHYFLNEASRHGKLTVVVARDSSVRSLKKKDPVQSERERLQNIGQLPYVFEAILGDKELGTYEIVKARNPQLICVGYDQRGLEESLRGKMSCGTIPHVSIVHLAPHHPEKYRSSIWQKGAE